MVSRHIVLIVVVLALVLEPQKCEDENDDDSTNEITSRLNGLEPPFQREGDHSCSYSCSYCCSGFGRLIEQEQDDVLANGS